MDERSPVEGQIGLFGDVEVAEELAPPMKVARAAGDESSTILVSFATTDDMDAFAALVGQPITLDTGAIYYPRKEWDDLGGRRSDKPLDMDRRLMGDQGALYGKQARSK